MKMSLALLFIFMTATAAQAATSKLICFAQTRGNRTDGMAATLTQRYDLQIPAFSRKGRAVLADTDAQITLTDVENNPLAIVKVRAFMHQDNKKAGLSMTISDKENYIVYASVMSELSKTKKNESGGPSVDLFASARPEIQAVMNQDLPRGAVQKVQADITGISLSCRLY